MCGIVGYVASPGVPLSREGLHEAVIALRHRGPDQGNTWESDRVLLGSTRLSIIDLDRGSQPMTNEDGSVVVVYNGEIWNHAALRRELTELGHTFVSGSDTEALVHGYEEWGTGIVEHLDGMFAFAIWDVRRQRLYLARDRLGKKPLYVRRTDRGLAFGSDARSTLLVSGAHPKVDRDRVAEYVFQRYVGSPHTLFEGIERLSPAHHGTYDGTELQVWRYWQLAAGEQRDLEPREVGALLLDATRKRLMSDVPLGVLLSGGVDSTAVLGLAREARADSLATFTVGFDDPVFDERPRARLAARHFGTSHHELLVGEQDFATAWPRLAWYRDEPIAEPSEIPLFLLAEFAGRHVRVALSGDGGDEVFGGYPKYRADALLRAGGRPAALLLQSWLKLLGVRRTHRQLGRAARTLSLRDPLVRWVSWFRTTEPGEIGRLLVDELDGGAVADRLAARLAELLAGFPIDAGRRMLLGDLFTYLPDNMLLRSDKVLMAGSLEGRMPLVDAALVARATGASAGSRAAWYQGKRILRRAIADLVPAELHRGPKRGFPVPIERFLVERRRSMVERLLLSDRCLSRGVFDADGLRAAISGAGQHLSVRTLFVLASFELWARTNVDQVSIEPPDHEEGLFAEAAPGSLAST